MIRMMDIPRSVFFFLLCDGSQGDDAVIESNKDG